MYVSLVTKWLKRYNVRSRIYISWFLVSANDLYFGGYNKPSSPVCQQISWPLEQQWTFEGTVPTMMGCLYFMMFSEFSNLWSVINIYSNEQNSKDKSHVTISVISERNWVKRAAKISGNKGSVSHEPNPESSMNLFYQTLCLLWLREYNLAKIK